MEIFSMILQAVFPGIVVGCIMSVWNSRQRKKETRAAGREDERKKSENLQISLLLASAQLSFAVAMAIKRGHPNGEIEAGVEQYNKALADFRKFEVERIAKLTVKH